MLFFHSSISITIITDSSKTHFKFSCKTKKLTVNIINNNNNNDNDEDDMHTLSFSFRDELFASAASAFLLASTVPGPFVLSNLVCLAVVDVGRRWATGEAAGDPKSLLCDGLYGILGDCLDDLRPSFRVAAARFPDGSSTGNGRESGVLIGVCAGD